MAIIAHNFAHPSPFKQVDSDVCCSDNEHISLSEFASCLPQYCTMKHTSSTCTCLVCPPLLNVAGMILEAGYVLLSEAFRSAFPEVTYHSHSVKHRLLQLPLVALRVGNPDSGFSEVYLFEHFPNVNYQQFLRLLNTFQEKSKKKMLMSKEQLKRILSIATSPRERECIQVTAVLASGLSATSARRHFGFDGVTARVKAIDDIAREIETIRIAHEEIAEVQEKAAMAQFGIDQPDSSPGSSESESDGEGELSCHKSKVVLPINEVVDHLRGGQFNWLELVSKAEDVGADVTLLESHFENVCAHLNEAERQLIHEAYLEVERTEAPAQVRETDALNGDIVSESDSDNPDAYLPGGDAALALKTRIATIRRKCARERAKAIAQKNYLRRKRNKKVTGILAKFPQIGKEIKQFVQDRSVGADAWRRTGVLTFDGRKEVKEKVTFQNQEALGTAVQSILFVRYSRPIMCREEPKEVICSTL